MIKINEDYLLRQKNPFTLFVTINHGNYQNIYIANWNPNGFSGKVNGKKYIFGVNIYSYISVIYMYIYNDNKYIFGAHVRLIGPGVRFLFGTGCISGYCENSWYHFFIFKN